MLYPKQVLQIFTAWPGKNAWRPAAESKRLHLSEAHSEMKRMRQSLFLSPKSFKAAGLLICYVKTVIRLLTYFNLRTYLARWNYCLLLIPDWIISFATLNCKKSVLCIWSISFLCFKSLVTNAFPTLLTYV